MANYDRKTLRDRIRRLLQIEPPVDQGTGAVGDAPIGQPDPSNAMINQAINTAIGIINRKVRVKGLTVCTVAVTADSTLRGSSNVTITGNLPAGVSAAEIYDVRWVAGDGSVILLAPYGFYQKEKKSYQAFQQDPPATPREFVLAGTQVKLFPPPAANGSLKFNAAGVMPLLNADTDTLDADLPEAYEDLPEQWAAMVLCVRKAGDVESQARMQSLAQLAIPGMVELYVWRNGYNAEAIGALRDTLQMFPAGVGSSTPAAMQQGDGNGNG